ncbi:MAG: S-layer homology domain-containing protein, partial [Acidimicrobiaceae bacterium]|nr:S-layer homology domain-containing protein [Acidimicrobiaceae bacterium]
AMTGASCSGWATPFTDVDPGSYAAGDIGCLYGLGVVNGTSGTTYSPDEFVTREQAAALLARLYRLVTDPSCSGGATPFIDVAPSSYAAGDVGCLHGLGVVKGTSGTTYSPSEYATRKQVAALLGRIWMAPAIIS